MRAAHSSNVFVRTAQSYFTFANLRPLVEFYFHSFSLLFIIIISADNDRTTLGTFIDFSPTTSVQSWHRHWKSVFLYVISVFSRTFS